MKITEIDYTTNPETITERDLTPEELLQLKKDKDAEIALQEQIDYKAAQKAALLDRLGITEDEAKLLLA